MPTKINFRSLLDYEPTEKYLDLMSKKGYQLREIDLYSYRFQKTDEIEMKYRLFFLEKTNKDMKPEIIQIFEDTGWEYVTNSKQYSLECLVFKSDASLNLEAYTDIESKQEMLQSIIKTVANIWFVLWFPVSVLVLIQAIFSLIETLDYYYYFTLFIFSSGFIIALNRFRIFFKYKNKL